MQSVRILLQKYVLKNGRRGDIKNIIDTIDEFGWTQHRLMNIGDRKGKILDEAIQTRKPKTVLELGNLFLIIRNTFAYSFLLGTFLGYSSLRIASQLSNDARFITIEADSKSAEIARSIHEYAGVADRIKIIKDYTENVIPHLTKDFQIDSFDLIFIDHHRRAYLRDFKMLENLGLIKSGTVIVADNVIHPGVPDYSDYVRNNPHYTTKMYESTLEYREDSPDGVEVSIRK